MLKSIDSKCGALNDTVVSQYAQIKGESDVTTFKYGNSILYHHNGITQAHKITSNFVKYLLDIKHYPDCEQGNLVATYTERAFCKGVHVNGLTQKAIDFGIEALLAGYGANIFSTKAANQCAFGFQLIHCDTVNPMSGKNVFIEFNLNEDGEECDLVYKNTQSTDCCIPARVVESNKNAELMRTCFNPVFSFH